MSYIDDPVMTLINKNFSYNDRRAIIEAMSESNEKRIAVYEGIGNYFLKKIDALKPGMFLGKYLQDKGDITNRKGYSDTMDSLAFLKDDGNMVVGQSASTVEEAMLNLKSRKKEFGLACKGNDFPFIKLLYATVSKACLVSTSLLIGCSSELNENNAKIDIPVSIASLATFNKYCKSGDVDKIIRYNIMREKVVKEGLLDYSLDTIVTIATAIITVFRNLVYWVYNTRMDMADYLEHQAMYLEMNKGAVEARADLNANQKKDIIKKQMEIKDKLLRLSDKIQLDEVKAARKAKEQSEKDTREMKSQDLGTADNNKDDSVPDFF